ncbi:GNAT family N-acetyltransferase [Lentzea sp. NPDC059081]|uniref:GNAT family N-acetyltransferase n=1 Tax=Lentzea sp. NPDC059081 TaxID=3346719 RepID=UPI00368C0B47
MSSPPRSVHRCRPGSVPGGRPLADGAVVCPIEDGDDPWIAYVITDPRWKRRGLGRAVVAASLGALAGATVFAGVTDGNTPSERLLGSLGFVRVGRA